jgi:hypothetical protein
MREAKGEVRVRVGAGAVATLGEGSARVLRRILFLYAALASGAFSHQRNRTLASAAARGVPHSVLRRAFFHAWALRSRAAARG